MMINIIYWSKQTYWIEIIVTVIKSNYITHTHTYTNKWQLQHKLMITFWTFQIAISYRLDSKKSERERKKKNLTITSQSNYVDMNDRLFLLLLFSYNTSACWQKKISFAWCLFRIRYPNNNNNIHKNKTLCLC